MRTSVHHGASSSSTSLAPGSGGSTRVSRTAKRSTLIPDVPAIADTLPGFEAVTWVGLLAPAGTPREIVSRMHAEIAKVVAAPDVRERFAASGAEPVATTPDHFGAYLAAEVKKWGTVVKQAKIPPVQ